MRETTNPFNENSSPQPVKAWKPPGLRLIMNAKAGSSRSPFSDLDPEANVSISQGNDTPELEASSTTHPLPNHDRKRPQSPSTSTSEQICDPNNSAQKRCKWNETRPSERFYATYFSKLFEMMKREWGNRPGFSVSGTQSVGSSGKFPSQLPNGSPSFCHSPSHENVSFSPEEWLRAFNYFVSATQQLMHQPSGTLFGPPCPGFNLPRPDTGLGPEDQMQRQVVKQPVYQPSASRRKQNFGCLNSANGSSRRTRTIFSDQQLNFLESVFRMNKFPDQATRCSLAQSLDLDEFRVNVWFHNRRAKWRRWENGASRRSTASQPPSEADASADPKV